jgi:DNA mismatch repair protein MutL
VPEVEAASVSPPGFAGQPPGTRPDIRGLRVLGTVSGRYLVADGASGLVLIDQRAAHERILFERLLAAARARQQPNQPLLLPVTVEFSPADASLLRQNEEHFVRLGFGIEPFGGDTFLVTAVPVHFPQENVAGILRDTLDDLREGGAAGLRPDEVTVAAAACRHAIGAEAPLTPEEVERLLADLSQAEMPYTSPAGRPVLVNIPHSEIHRRFGRRTG